MTDYRYRVFRTVFSSKDVFYIYDLANLKRLLTLSKWANIGHGDASTIFLVGLDCLMYVPCPIGRSRSDDDEVKTAIKRACHAL